MDKAAINNFTGSGNSLYLARELQKRLPGSGSYRSLMVFSPNLNMVKP
jgi:hypothetical protein